MFRVIDFFLHCLSYFIFIKLKEDIKQLNNRTIIRLVKADLNKEFRADWNRTVCLVLVLVL